MELCKQIIEKFFSSDEFKQIREDTEIEYDRIVISTCYNALKRIKEIISDDSFDDPECFMKIEAVVRVFEEIGSNGGGRHDFG